MKSNLMKRFLRPSLFTLFGALIGYIYYWQIGCASGACPLTSNPYIATVYGAALGYLLSVLFERKPKKENTEE